MLLEHLNNNLVRNTYFLGVYSYQYAILKWHAHKTNKWKRYLCSQEVKCSNLFFCLSRNKFFPIMQIDRKLKI